MYTGLVVTMNIAKNVEEYVENIHRDIEKSFDNINYIVDYNQHQVIEAMQECRISERHFHHLRDMDTVMMVGIL